MNNLTWQLKLRRPDDPELGFFCVKLAQIYEKKKDYKNVREYYTRAVEKHPSGLSGEEMTRRND